MTRMVRERISFVQMTPSIRRRLEATLENLIALLDAIDGDSDLETTFPEFDPEWPPRFPDRAPSPQCLDDEEDGGDDEHSAQLVTLNSGPLT